MCVGMPKLKLSYFDFHGGRGEPARLAFSIGNVPFEDDRISGPTWGQLKAQSPFGGLPILEVDGQQVTQSNGINRYAGKLSKLYPEDLLQAAFCDEAMDAVEDLYHQIGPTFSMPDEQKKFAREVLASGPLLATLRNIEKRLLAHGGQYFADSRLTVADLKVFGMTRHLRSGVLDHLPKDLVDRAAPKLVEHHERVRNDPGVKAYYTRHGVA
jgi:prostaglandin-H2 D-isomerase / glutathione transferase